MGRRDTRSEEIRDPRAFRWVESGVSGLARMREWDVTTVVALPELEGDETVEVDFTGLGEGLIRVEGEASEAVVDRLARRVEYELPPPYEARAVRKNRREWAVAARALRAELVRLPRGLDAVSLEVARAPDGELTALADGDVVVEPVELPLADALAELERRARERFQAFVVRADKVDEERWQLTIDPL